MKKFKSIEEWVVTNPSTDEVAKVLNLINRGAASTARKAVYESENLLRKYQRALNYYNKIGLTNTKELEDAIAKTKAKVTELRKDLPVLPKRAKKTETVSVES